MKSTTLSLSVVLLAAGTLVLMGGADSGPQVADAFFWGWPSYSWAWPSYFYPSFYFPSYMYLGKREVGGEEGHHSRGLGQAAHHTTEAEPEKARNLHNLHPAPDADE